MRSPGLLAWVTVCAVRSFETTVREASCESPVERGADLAEDFVCASCRIERHECARAAIAVHHGLGLLVINHEAACNDVQGVVAATFLRCASAHPRQSCFVV